MLAMNMVSLVCCCCKRGFERKAYEHKFRQKRGYSPCCSRACSTVIRNQKSPNTGNVKNFHGTNQGGQNDTFSPFRCYLIKARARRNQTTDLTLDYLKRVWESQRGICPYTGYPMSLPRNTNHPIKNPRKASLDRIDSSKGYVQGNVEFVCLAVNYAKNGFSKEQMTEFFNPKSV